MSIERLQPCLFCGCNQVEIQSTNDGDMEKGGMGWGAVCICTHCTARGSYMGGSETEEEAIEKAKENWQEAGRITWYQHLSRIWRTIVHDIEELID